MAKGGGCGMATFATEKGSMASFVSFTLHR